MQQTQAGSSRQLLEQARQKFISGDFPAAKQYKLLKKLQTVNVSEQQGISLQVNKLLIDFESGSQENCEVVLKKLLDLLTEINIELYKKNRPNEILFIGHESLYYNIVAIAEYLCKGNLSQLVGEQALFYFKSLQTNTALMLIAQGVRKSLNQNNLPGLLALIQKYQAVSQSIHGRNYSNQEQKFRTIINACLISALLKLGVVEQSQALFMLRFDEDSQKFVSEDKTSRTKRKSKVLYKDIVTYLKAQIDFTNKNYQKSINYMLTYLSSQSNRDRIYAQNNIAINLISAGKALAAERILSNNCETLYKALHTNKKVGTELPELLQKTKHNITLAYLSSRQNLSSSSHYNVETDQKYYNHMKTCDELFSYKQEYRNGQCALNLYHSTLEKTARKLPWEQIHDNYDTCYYLPNVPYYQFKGKNKNSHLANKKPVYRRYILNQWNDENNEEPIDKDTNRRKFQKQASALKHNQILSFARECFKKALLLLQKAETTTVRVEQTKADLTKLVNEKLYHQHSKFKSSILCLLTYTSLCLCKWHEVIKYSEQFVNKKCGQANPDNNYAVLTYQLQAYCEVGRIQDAYKVMHQIVGNGLSKNGTFYCRDGSNLANCNMEQQLSQQINFIYNMSVLHSRDNRIPESHQSIQKLFTQMNVLLNYPKTQLPLSVLELLIHYNLRTQNQGAALQLIKRRRILGTGGTVKPILNITK